MDDFFG